MLHKEDVYAQRRFVMPMVAIVTALAVGGVWLLLGADQVGDGIGLVVSGALLGTVLRLFAVLHVRVEGDRLRARFGPWGLNLKTWEIDGARAEEYRWGSYGGWGPRAGLDGGRKGRAMSVPFLRSGVIVETKQGKRHYINSRRPDELAAVVNQISKGGS